MATAVVAGVQRQGWPRLLAALELVAYVVIVVHSQVRSSCATQVFQVARHHWSLASWLLGFAGRAMFGDQHIAFGIHRTVLVLSKT